MIVVQRPVYFFGCRRNVVDDDEGACDVSRKYGKG